jgi:hypothetical protein
MADTKISALTASTTPLAGTEVLPIVQSSTTKQVSVANLTAGRAVSAASLALTTSPLPATSGGTDQSSYAVGDLLYASTTTALSKLADVATGNALISGGVGVAPSYGKIGLTTHVSGTLPVANGGTNLTSFNANGMVYASSTSALATSSTITTNGTNFAIGSSGDLSLGTGNLLLYGNTNPAVGIAMVSASTSPNIRMSHATGTASGSAYMEFNYNSSGCGSITQNGTSSVLYNVTSDQRLKENIVDAPEFGDVIDSIQVRSFDWKTDNTHQRAGFIAQELVTIAPEAVYQPEDTEKMMAVDYSKLVPMLVKEIQSLRARLQAANIA